MSRYCIVGGGLSGLSAALHLRQKIPDSIITVLEASHRFGGWIETHKTATETDFEIGPRSVRVASPTSPFLFDVCEKLNLSGDLIPVTYKATAAQKRFIYVHGKLHELKPKLFTSSPPFQRPLLPTLISSLWNDRKFARGIGEEDMSVDEYFRTHFNDELADIAINSMMRGIYAGDSKELGVKSVFPHIIRMEEESNGLIRGMIKEMSPFRSASPLLDSALHRRALQEKWSIWGIKGGMETIITALVNYLNKHNVSMNLDSKCVKVDFRDDGEVECTYETDAGMRNLKCDHIFLATSSHVCSQLLENSDSIDQGTISPLLDIPYVDVAVVGMDYKNVRLPVDGFGHLIPSWEIPHVLGVVYDSCIYPKGNANSEEAYTKLTCMMGGAWFKPHCQGMEEKDFLQLARDTVRSQLNINSEPSDYVVRINRQCIPQYPIGYQENVKKIRQILLDSNLSLSLIGSTFDGVSVNDCVASAYNAVENLSDNRK